jgi:dTDP-glucose pyrophosphorylase
MGLVVTNQNPVWQNALLDSRANIEQAINVLNVSALKIVIVTNENNKFLGTISDGDIRRGILKGCSLNSPIKEIIQTNSLVVDPEMNRDAVLQLMVTRKIQQIPIVDDQGNISGLHLWDEMNLQPKRNNVMVIMAGGKGTRLLPITEDRPKPMLEILGKPILEHILQRAGKQGFSNFVISLGHLGHLIEEYFEDGNKLGISISYIREDIPLGTAGALSLLEFEPNGPVIITNGDVLTDLNYGEMIDFHVHQKADATMATRVYEIQNPFGVVNTDGLDITGYVEKPVSRNNINAGVYVFDPKLFQLLNRNEPMDMSTVFERLIQSDYRVIAFPIHEQWLDIGRPEELKIASESVDSSDSVQRQS